MVALGALDGRLAAAARGAPQRAARRRGGRRHRRRHRRPARRQAAVDVRAPGRGAAPASPHVARRHELVRRVRGRPGRRRRLHAAGRLRLLPVLAAATPGLAVDMRSAASAASWSATTTDVRARCPGRWPSPKACRPPPCRCTRRSSTRRSRSSPWRSLFTRLRAARTPDRQVSASTCVLAGAALRDRVPAGERAGPARTLGRPSRRAGGDAVRRGAAAAALLTRRS